MSSPRVCRGLQRARHPEGHRDDVCGEKRHELGRPDGFLHWAGTLGYPLSDQVQVGRLETISCREAEDP